MLTRLRLFLTVFGLPPDVVAATLGDVGVQEVVGLSTGVSPIPDMLLSLPVITVAFLL